MLKAQHISYQIDKFSLINNISLDLKLNELSVVIGTNGAGKSTLLRLLTGFYQPTQGECLFLGKPLDQWCSKQLSQSRTVMKQHGDISFPFSAKEVIAMGRAPYGKRNLKRALDEVIEKTHCESLCHKDYRLLSGGEKQRIQLARVLAQLWDEERRPRLLFLDEPTSALDLYHQQQMLRLLKTLTVEEPFSVCCILHDLNLASLYADRIFLIHEGQLVAQGSPEQVLTLDILKKWYKADLSVQSHPCHFLPQVFLTR